MLRMLTVSHDRHDAIPYLYPKSNKMDKDAPLVTATVPDYHNGLHEKTNKSKSGALSPGSSSGGGFQVYPLSVTLERPSDCSSALY